MCCFRYLFFVSAPEKSITQFSMSGSPCFEFMLSLLFTRKYAVMKRHTAATSVALAAVIIDLVFVASFLIRLIIANFARKFNGGLCVYG